ncbi:sulfite exporter TauE/SafE family protein [Dietzia sp.]|uniref:sulfite exporter TauE/SafE family protein n=1 Tax=Dietzia sp. TaxID=1871616 RepID=UPI002FDA37A9
MIEILGSQAPVLLLVSLAIGVVIGLTGMGGGALMTPALVLLGIPPTTAVANDLVVNAANKVVGATVHWRRGKPNMKIAFWLILGSVPSAYFGAWLVHELGVDDIQGLLKSAIGVTLLIASSAYILRAFLELRGKISSGSDEDPPTRIVPTLLVGIIGGVMVGVTSVGSGTLIMMCIMLLYPTLAPLRLVGTDLVQAVPLVIAAAIGHVTTTGIQWSLVWPLLVGGTIGTFFGARLAPMIPSGLIRRSIAIVLALTGIAMLGAPAAALGILAAGAVLLGPLVWGWIRHLTGHDAFPAVHPRGADHHGRAETGVPGGRGGESDGPDPDFVI